MGDAQSVEKKFTEFGHKMAIANMTRRKFVQKLIRVGSAVIFGTCKLARQTYGGLTKPPRKFVRAIRMKYPGSLRPLRDIRKPGKWSG